MHIAMCIQVGSERIKLQNNESSYPRYVTRNAKAKEEKELMIFNRFTTNSRVPPNEINY